MENLKNRSGRYRTELLALIFCMAAYMWVLYAFTGQWPWKENPYNSYTLQALGWLQGHLDLGQNYEHLELAVYQGKYFVSFPPFPSYVMLPFALLFGEKTPDGLIAVGIWLLGAVYTLRLFRETAEDRENAFFWCLFLLIGTNLVFIKVNGWVWFLAQSMCFTLSVMALYYAAKGKAGRSLAFWACSVGARPLQILWLPVLLVILWRGLRPEEEGPFFRRVWAVLKKRLPCLIPAFLIGVSFMVLNYLRFGDIMEFGHNYLPEFLEARNGQFDAGYIVQNAKNLFRLPRLTESGTLDFYGFDGFAFWLASPVFLSWFYYLVRYAAKGLTGLTGSGGRPRNKRSSEKRLLTGMIVMTAVVHTLALLSHKTMGGWHFGNRYMNDLLPYIFYGILLLLPEKDHSLRFQYGLFALGAVLNAVGTVALYNYWI